MAVFVITLAGCGPQVPQEVSSQADAEKISGWIESMSLEEKAYFVTGTGMSGFGLQTEGFVSSPGAPVWVRHRAWCRERPGRPMSWQTSV